MESKAYDIVLAPDSILTTKTLELSEKLKSKGVHFTLGNETFYPHVSLYMLQLNEVGLNRTMEQIENLANITEAIRARADHYYYTHDYLDVEYKKTNELIVLQQKIIKLLNPLRDGLRENDKARLETSTGEELSNILEYGYRSVGNFFRPHLTFTRFTSNQENILPSLPPKDVFSGTYNSLGVYELGNNGTCAKLVKTWDLKLLKF